MVVKDAPTEKLIAELASRLEKMEQFKPPEWSVYVKTGVHKERPPTQDNWWFIRSASILRKVHLNQGIGVSRLRKLYGGRKNLGHQPEHKKKASGAIIRKIMQQLEAAGFLESKKDKKGRVLNRIVTKEGRNFLKEASKTAKS